MHQYFVNNPDIEASDSVSIKLELSDDDLRHIKSQRLKVGEHIGVVDRSKNYFETEILSLNNGDVEVRVSQKVVKREKNYRLSLFYCLSKGSKTEDVLRGSTEVGIDEFWPIISSRSVVKLDAKKAQSRVERYKKIAKSASMQSGRVDIPHVHEIATLDSILGDLSQFDDVIVFWEMATLDDKLSLIFKQDKERQSFKNGKKRNVAIFVGPEGGFDTSEVEDIKRHGNTHICTMGDTILRTETAGVVACMLTKYELTR